MVNARFGLEQGVKISILMPTSPPNLLRNLSIRVSIVQALDARTIDYRCDDEEKLLTWGDILVSFRS